MSSTREDFFLRIAQQNMGLASVVQPLTAPRFAAGPVMLDELSREIMTEFYPAAFPPPKPNEALQSPSPPEQSEKTAASTSEKETETHAASSLPSVASATSTPSAPSVPAAPAVPSAPSVHAVPSAPAAPSAPFTSSVPSAHAAPSVPAVPSAPAAPSAPFASSVPSAHAAPSVPAVHSVSSVSSIPSESLVQVELIPAAPDEQAAIEQPAPVTPTFSSSTSEPQPVTQEASGVMQLFRKEKAGKAQTSVSTQEQYPSSQTLPGDESNKVYGQEENTHQIEYSPPPTQPTQPEQLVQLGLPGLPTPNLDFTQDNSQIDQRKSPEDKPIGHTTQGTQYIPSTTPAPFNSSAQFNREIEEPSAKERMNQAPLPLPEHEMHPAGQAQPNRHPHPTPPLFPVSKIHETQEQAVEKQPEQDIQRTQPTGETVVQAKNEPTNQDTHHAHLTQPTQLKNRGQARKETKEHTNELHTPEQKETRKTEVIQLFREVQEQPKQIPVSLGEQFSEPKDGQKGLPGLRTPSASVANSSTDQDTHYTHHTQSNSEREIQPLKESTIQDTNHTHHTYQTQPAQLKNRGQARIEFSEPKDGPKDLPGLKRGQARIETSLPEDIIIKTLPVTSEIAVETAAANSLENRQQEGREWTNQATHSHQGTHLTHHTLPTQPKRGQTKKEHTNGTQSPEQKETRKTEVIQLFREVQEQPKQIPVSLGEQFSEPKDGQKGLPGLRTPSASVANSSTDQAIHYTHHTQPTQPKRGQAKKETKEHTNELHTPEQKETRKTEVIQLFREVQKQPKQIPESLGEQFSEPKDGQKGLPGLRTPSASVANSSTDQAIHYNHHTQPTQPKRGQAKKEHTNELHTPEQKETGRTEVLQLFLEVQEQSPEITQAPLFSSPVTPDVKESKTPAVPYVSSVVNSSTGQDTHYTHHTQSTYERDIQPLKERTIQDTNHTHHTHLTQLILKRGQARNESSYEREIQPLKESTIQDTNHTHHTYQTQPAQLKNRGQARKEQPHEPYAPEQRETGRTEVFQLFREVQEQPKQIPASLGEQFSEPKDGPNSLLGLRTPSTSVADPSTDQLALSTHTTQPTQPNYKTETQPMKERTIQDTNHTHHTHYTQLTQQQQHKRGQARNESSYESYERDVQPLKERTIQDTNHTHHTQLTQQQQHNRGQARKEQPSANIQLQSNSLISLPEDVKTKALPITSETAVVDSPENRHQDIHLTQHTQPKKGLAKKEQQEGREWADQETHSHQDTHLTHFTQPTPPAKLKWHRRETTPETTASSSIRVNIGRIRIKTEEKQTPVRKFKRPSPSLSLQDYLHLRKHPGRHS